jgi:hypothetical protein
MGNILGSSSEPLKNGESAKLIFDNFYLFDKKSREKKENPKKSEIQNVLKKSKKYIESYANLDGVVPKGVKIKVSKITPQKDTLICYIIFNIQKNVQITRDEYQNYIEDRANGPFEAVWDDAPAHIHIPKIEYKEK